MDFLIRMIKEGNDKPFWWNTCAAYNDCSLCPYGVTDTGEYVRCGIDKTEFINDKIS